MADNDDITRTLTPDEALALEAVGHASTMARNDPNWQADMEEMKRDLDGVAQEVRRVTLVDNGNRGHHVEVTLARPTHRPAARTTAGAMARLFEAEMDVRQAPQRAGHEHADVSYRQPQRHVHYKDDRKK